MKNLNYLVDHILLFHILLFQVYHQRHETVTDNPEIRIYVYKIENRITFAIKTGYYLKLLMPETMKLFGGTESKTINDKNSEKMCLI